MSPRSIVSTIVVTGGMCASFLAAAHAEPQLGAPEVEIQRLEEKEPKVETLRFLKENRDFFRAQLDLLRLTFGDRYFGEGGNLDPRSLMFQELLAKARAQEDSSTAYANRDRSRTALESVTELAELENELLVMEEMLLEQRKRLSLLEQDYQIHQETALIVLLAGVPSTGVPDEVVFCEEGGDTYRVSLTSLDRSALAEGGLAQLVHAFVEPRELRFRVSIEGEGWSGSSDHPIVIEPERDKLNFLQIDLSSLGSSPEAAIPTRTWVR
jgi:hypothetical protein